MAREDWEYIAVRKNTRMEIERLRALLILQSGKKQTYDDTIRYLLQLLPEPVKAQVQSEG